MALFEDSQEHKDFRLVFKKFVAREITPHCEEWEEAGVLPRELWKKLGAQGFLCLGVPEEYGGLGLDIKYALIINEELIRGGAYSTGITLHSDVAVPYLVSYGTEELKREILPKALSGEVICAVAMTEPNTGSDLAAIRTRAVRDGDSYVINGQKTFISNGVSGDVIITACKIESDDGSRGISLIVVNGDNPGLSRGRKLQKMGRRMQDTSELFYEDCRVPVGNLLGEEGKGFKYLMSKLEAERLEICTKCITLAEEALKEALKYAKEREAFGKRIGDFQANAFKLADMATEVEIGRTFFNALVEEYMRGEDVTMKVSMAKAWLGEMVNRVAYDAVQLHGGYGYTEEYPVCRMYRDARGLSILAGTTEIMKVIIARKLGLNGM